MRDSSVVSSPSPKNMYKSSLPTYIKTPTSLKKIAPNRSNSFRSAPSARADERVDVEAYDPFNNDEREDIEDSRSLFSEENSRDLWPQMPLSISHQDDEQEYFSETGPTGTPKRKRTGSTPFKELKPSEGDNDGFTNGFRVSYTSSTSQPTSKSSFAGNFTNHSHPFDEFRGSSVTTTPKRTSKPSILNKYMPSGQEARDGVRVTQPSPAIPRRLSQSSVSSGKFASANETEPTHGFRSSFSSAFTPQRGARLSIGSVHTNQTGNDNGSVASASQRSTKSTISSVSNKYTASLGQGSEKSNAPKLVVTPLRAKKSSVSNRYLSAVSSKVQDLEATAKVQEPANVEPANVEPPAKAEPRNSWALRRSSSFSTLKVEEPVKNDDESAEVRTHRRSSSFSHVEVGEPTKIEASAKRESGKLGPHLLRSSSVSAPKVEAMEDPAKIQAPTKTIKHESGKLGPHLLRSSSFSRARKEETAKVEVPAKRESGKPGPHLLRSSSFSMAKVETVEETAKVEVPAETETGQTDVHLRSSSFSSVPKPKKTSVPYIKAATPPNGEDDMEQMIESRVAMEMAKMRIELDEQVQRIEELMEQKYRNRIDALEEKTAKMNKIIGKMISKRKSMGDVDMDRLEV